MIFKTRALFIGIIVLIIGCATTVTKTGESLLPYLQYDQNKMDTGIVYTYQIYNTSRNKIINMYVYNYEGNKITIFKEYWPVLPEVLHIKNFDLDTRYFVFNNAYAENPFSYMHKPFTNDVTFHSWNFENKTQNLSLRVYSLFGNLQDRKFNVRVSTFPCFDLSIYQFDFIYAMRFFTGDRGKTYNVGNLYGPKYMDVLLRYGGEEAVNAILCDKWIIEGKGSARQEIWFDKNSPYYPMIQYKNDMRIGPFNNINIDYISRENMTLEEWDIFVADKTREIQIRLNFPDKPEGETR